MTSKGEEARLCVSALKLVDSEVVSISVVRRRIGIRVRARAAEEVRATDRHR